MNTNTGIPRVGHPAFLRSKIGQQILVAMGEAHHVTLVFLLQVFFGMTRRRPMRHAMIKLASGRDGIHNVSNVGFNGLIHNMFVLLCFVLANCAIDVQRISSCWYEYMS